MEDLSLYSSSEAVYAQPYRASNGLGECYVELGLEDDRTSRTLKGKEHNRLRVGVAKKSKKHTSEAWDHFSKVVENGVATKAQCKYCTAVLTYRVNSGTSHLLKHARTVCPGKRLQHGAGQKQLKIIKAETGRCTVLELKEKGELKGKEKADKFDQNISRNELASMVVRHEYPLSMVDHVGFRKFVTSLNSSFKIISGDTLKNDIMKMYNDGRSSLKTLLEHNESRVAITTSVWTASDQRKRYMAVTSHFIDKQWILHHRTLR